MRKNLACKGVLSKLAAVVVFLRGVYEAKSSEDSMFYGDLEVWGAVEKLIILLIRNGFYLENNEVQKAKSTQINALCG